MHKTYNAKHLSELMKKERVAIFIDGSNLYNSLKRYNLKKTFEEIVSKIEDNENIVKIFYYTASLDITNNEKKYWKHQKFIKHLEKIPKFKVVLCTLKKNVDKKGIVTYQIKEDDVYLATHLIVNAYTNEYDTAIIVSGDQDFTPAIKAVQKIGKKVINAYFNHSSSYALRRVCDDSFNLRKRLVEDKSVKHHKKRSGIA